MYFGPLLEKETETIYLFVMRVSLRSTWKPAFVVCGKRSKIDVLNLTKGTTYLSVPLEPKVKMSNHVALG